MSRGRLNPQINSARVAACVHALRGDMRDRGLNHDVSIYTLYRRLSQNGDGQISTFFR